MSIAVGEPKNSDLELPNAEGTSAYQVLLKSDRLVVGPLGEAIEMPPQKRALSHLVGAAYGEKAFLQLATSSSAVARLYGLCGLRALSSSQYERTKAELKASLLGAVQVEAQSGCETWVQTASELSEHLAIEEDCAPARTKRTGTGITNEGSEGKTAGKN